MTTLHLTHEQLRVLKDALQRHESYYSSIQDGLDPITAGEHDYCEKKIDYIHSILGDIERAQREEFLGTHMQDNKAPLL